MSILLSSSRIHFPGQRIVWVLLAATGLAFFLTTVPDRAEQLLSICPVSFDCARTQLTLIEVHALKNWGVALQHYAYYVLSFAAYWVASLLLPLRQGQELTHVIVMMISNTFYALTLLVIPITIAFSIQQYRLWEIDPIINRSLVYGFLTLFLGLIYAGYALLPPEIHR